MIKSFLGFAVSASEVCLFAVKLCRSRSSGRYLDSPWPRWTGSAALQDTPEETPGSPEERWPETRSCSSADMLENENGARKSQTFSADKRNQQEIPDF